MAKMIEVASISMTRDESTYVSRRLPGCATLVGYIQNPGGIVEPGEYPNQAAARELFEETGIDVRNNLSRLIPITAFSAKNEAGVPYIVFAFELELEQTETPERKEPEKNGPWNPVPIAEIALGALTPLSVPGLARPMGELIKRRIASGYFLSPREKSRTHGPMENREDGLAVCETRMGGESELERKTCTGRLMDNIAAKDMAYAAMKNEFDALCAKHNEQSKS